MKHRLRCLLILMVFLLLLTWMSGIAMAQIGNGYPFRLDIPDTYNSSLWMPQWNTPLNFRGMAGAQAGTEYPFLFSFPYSYQSSLWMAYWNTTLTRMVNSPADWSNNSYYRHLTPLTRNGIPLFSYPWSYSYSTSSTPPQKTEPVQPVFENLSLFKMGTLYARIDEPYTYIFAADYAGSEIKTLGEEGNIVELSSIFHFMLDPETYFLFGDPNDPDDEVYQYYVNDLGADPDLFGENDPNLAALFGRESFKVDFDFPIFADPNLRFGGHMAERIIEQGTLGWKVSVQGAVEGHPMEITPLPTDPYDGMPTYLPANYDAINVALLYQKPSFPPGAVIALEAALWNSGISVWPNIAALDYTPQQFGDLTVTVEVTNGVDSDFSTFPISVVDYPVENHAPVPLSERVELTFYVGEPGVHLFQCIDPDCFIFSQAYNLYGEIPEDTHMTSNTPGITPRDDMSSLMWDLHCNDLPSYQYGPWVNNLINQDTGIMYWVPQFDGEFNMVVSCSDNRGGTAHIEAEILCIQKGGPV
ncbi:MAG: hypothetical protein ACMUIM_07430 [bacterium]